MVPLCCCLLLEAKLLTVLTYIFYVLLVACTCSCRYGCAYKMSTFQVLKILKTSYGDQYTADNLCISGIHTHSAPAGTVKTTTV